MDISPGDCFSRSLTEYKKYFPEDVKDALDALREGYTIALINIKPLRDKDMVELKRAIEKIKKTCDALEGDLAGVSENFIVVTPSFAHIYRSVETEEVKA